VLEELISSWIYEILVYPRRANLAGIFKPVFFWAQQAIESSRDHIGDVILEVLPVNETEIVHHVNK